MLRIVAHATYAPKRTSSPGPKLTTLEALKMRTNPSAISEYTPPTAMPVMTSWSMNTRCSFIAARLPRVEVFDHLLILGQDRRAPDLPGPRQLSIVRAQLLVEEPEGTDARHAREILVHARHHVRHQCGDLGLLREGLERRARLPVGL